MASSAIISFMERHLIEQLFAANRQITALVFEFWMLFYWPIYFQKTYVLPVKTKNTMEYSRSTITKSKI